MFRVFRGPTTKPNIMKRHILALTFLAGPLFAQAPNSGIIAKVADEEVTASTLAPFFENLSEPDRQALKENPSLLSQAVRNVIVRRLLLKEALASGWDKRPEVEKQMEQAKEAVVIESYLSEVAKIPEGYPSDKDVETVYEARKAELVIPKQFELAQIYIPQSANADKVQAAAAKAMADQVEKKLKAGGDFAAIARETSQEKRSAANGGNIGWVALTNLQPEIRAAVENLGKGAVAPAIRLGDGVYFVKVLDVKDARTATLEEVKPRLVQALRAERAKQNRQAYLSRVQQQNPVAIDELSLGKLVK